jgi:2,3,4,5-tetrahydropyridine-2-carboxylate N-succinyltransferase
VSLEVKMNQIWSQIENGKAATELKSEEQAVVLEVISKLDLGEIRVSSKTNGQWTTAAWIKKAILTYFRLQSNSLITAGDLNFYDKVPIKKWTGRESVRCVPPAVVRKGAYISSGVILMPSYVNIGAFVDSGSMVDTWATVGSCAQVGKNVHLSGGVGLGGVLEPLQADPVIIEDNVFVGSRCILVEGTLIEEGAVLGAGVTITGSTKIIDVTQKDEVVYKGRVPPRSVVIPGSYQKAFPAGNFGVPCALIIGQRTASTDLKTSLNQALRDFNVPI